MDRGTEPAAAGPRVRFGQRSMPLPRHRGLRLAIGGSLVFFGCFGFLPILGFWMIPFGLLILSVDMPAARRLRRRVEIWWGRRQQRRALAAEETRKRDVP